MRSIVAGDQGSDEEANLLCQAYAAALIHCCGFSSQLQSFISAIKLKSEREEKKEEKK